MHRTYLEIFVDGMNDKLFFVLIIFVQIIFIFQGLDFADAGFAADFYRRIFSDPSSVQYNFMYWFTGIIGGSWLKLFPGFGLLGLRIAGVISTTITLWISYNLLKKYLYIGPLRLSLFLIVLFLTTAIKEINYDDITALFFMCTAWFLFSGLTREKPYMLFLAGAFISLNMFSRLPNILGLILILAIWFSGYLNRKTVNQVIIQSLLFILGFLVMCVLLFGWMKSMHHDVYFLNSLKLTRQMGSAIDNSHGLYTMLKLYIVHFGEAVSISMVVIVALWNLAAAWRKLKTDLPASIPFLPIVKWGILIILTAICIYRAKKDPDFWFYLFLFYAGTSLITGFLIITGRQPKNLRLLAAIGCLMLLVMPFGSNYVLMSVGKYSIWIIVPITIDYMLNIRSLSSRVVVSENNLHSYEQVIDTNHMNGLRNTTIYLTLIYILSVTYFYPYFDRSNRALMHFEVRNEHVKGIYTTESRAKVINELLTQTALYIKPDDYVLAYDCIPMFYYLTETKPYMHNSWPWLYDNAVFKEELYKSLKETHICPIVIMQKRSTIGNNWPDNYSENYTFRPQALDDMNDFLRIFKYSQVWENDFFKIYIPASKTVLE
jgi:Dolichyl-phosphate-mannose-protein mannosyltransferase